MFGFGHKPSTPELREIRARSGHFVILHAVAAEKAFGKDAVVIAENDPAGYLGNDGTQDYYLGVNIPIKFIKNKPNGNYNKKSNRGATDQKRGIRN